MLGSFKFKVATDLMSVTGCIEKGMDEITPEYIKAELKNAGVTSGLKDDNILALVDSQAYGLWAIVAEGKKPGETINGYYDFLFDRSNENSKTTINEDGSVSYGKARVMVEEGTKIAIYHPPINGSYGYTVYSSVIAPRPAKNQVLKCNEGCEMVENEIFATVSGEIIVKETYISVQKVLVIDGNAKYGVDTLTQFIGDVHVKGDVLAGVTIQAEGNIEVDGTVEAANLIAGKDIIIRGGIQSDSSAKIQAIGNIICPFIENATVAAGGSIKADYVMQSNLVASDSIEVQGRHGTVIGGTAIAGKFILVKEAGNAAFVRTKLEIVNDNLKNIEFCHIIIENRVYENARIVIGGVENRTELFPNREYHLVNGEITWCEIGKYVPQKRVEIKAPTKKPTIMLVDDEPIILKTFYSFLSADYEIMLSTSAKDAKKQLESKVPDLILLDYQMPNMNGAEFLESIRKTPWKAYSKVSVIFVTAITDRDAITRVFTKCDPPPQGYLVKPIGHEDLLNAVNKFFSEEK